MKDGHLEAKDLMIGDWVKVLPISKRLEKHYSKVGALTRNIDNSISIKGGYFPYWTGWCVSEEDIVPIPLTPEILEKNGFCDRGNAGWQNPEYDITYYLESNTFTHNVYKQEQIDIIHNVKYVHELQHALRLCGLNDLADKFKIFYSI